MTHLTDAMRAKGTKALAQWRKRKATAEKKGGKYLEKWKEGERLKKEAKSITPLRAIKNHCINCSNNQLSEITDCTVTTCGLYPVRPFQRKEA